MKKIMTRVTSLSSVFFSFLLFLAEKYVHGIVCRCCTCPRRAAHVNTFKANIGWFYYFSNPHIPSFHLLIFIPLLIAELYTGLFGLSNYLKRKVLKKKINFSVCIWIEVKINFIVFVYFYFFSSFPWLLLCKCDCRGCCGWSGRRLLGWGAFTVATFSGETFCAVLQWLFWPPDGDISLHNCSDLFFFK